MVFTVPSAVKIIIQSLRIENKSRVKIYKVAEYEGSMAETSCSFREDEDPARRLSSSGLTDEHDPEGPPQERWPLIPSYIRSKARGYNADTVAPPWNPFRPVSRVSLRRRENTEKG